MAASDNRLRRVLLLVIIGLVVGWLYSWMVGATQIKAEAS